MNILINVLVFIIALQHFCFLILEMFLWQKPIGIKIFKMSQEVAETTAVLAGNQGLYNGFLSVGLCWSLIHPSQDVGYSLKLFFIGCVIAAGLYGWLTVGKTILYAQALPAILTLTLLVTFY
jgi:putative membrane protein